MSPPIGSARAGLVSQVGDEIPDSVVFYPESGDLSNFSGNTGDYDINNTNPVSSETGLSLKVTTDSPSDIVSISGLSSYPQRSDQFSFRSFSDGNTDAFAALGFNAVDTDNFHFAEINYGQSRIAIFKRDGGSFSLQNETSYSPPLSESLHLVTEWQSDDTIVAEAYQESKDPENDSPDASVSTTITPFTSNGSPDTGVAIRSQRDTDGTVAMFDYWIRERGI